MDRKDKGGQEEGGKNMIIFEYKFDVVPGKMKEFLEYVEKEGRPAWKKFKEVKDFRVLTNVYGVSSPQRIVQVTLPDMAALEKIFGDEDFQKVRDDFHSFVYNLSHTILKEVPTD
jgi:hypothetical protein